ncbi:ribonuclease catalytic domain-containing protein [Desulfobacula toluolica]|uniref:Predicted exoribonlease II n=1 Tax=Desulfobacula toluolica (strain DSM 7467 / Tol2) TaxID=651182 RepID=K0N4Y2_DESTT|nr:ribonuclease catalytic domain-containing protein [Desulfobacula toluolica]CCK79179.1 predicted exoribonlease II [Desulfobacula toluolica Tol2]
MNTGNIVEYIDQQKIISAVIIQETKGKLKLLTENNREVNFSEKRLSHVSHTCLDTHVPRDSIVIQLKQLTQNRKKLSETINIRELWELLHEESEDIDISTMTLFCFDPPLTCDHEAAVIRAFFYDSLYFKFNKTIFSPYTPQQVEAKKRQIKEAAKKEILIRKGAVWINDVLNNKNGSNTECDQEIIDILKSYYLFNNNCSSYMTAKQIIKKSSINSPDQLFNVFVKAGIWDQNINVDLLTMQIPTAFSKNVMEQAKNLARTRMNFFDDPLRKDLTDLPLITIDGQSTLDFDDAISLENTESGYTLGIHIIDVDAYIKSDDPIDLAARERASSIYMPDDKLPMIPPNLSEDLCSLKENEIRPGISTIIKLSRFFEIQDYKIVPSIIKVHKQMSYSAANLLNGKDDPITTLYKIAIRLREKRLKAGATQITLPEVNVWIEENQEIGYLKIDRENPSRMLISEMMIFANSLMAEFLSANNVPAVFRSQAQPKQRLFKGIETSLILNFMQRKQLSRAIIGTEPESHSGLGVKAYATATSPIRRYHDLLTQRQIKSIFGYDKAYTKTELETIIQSISVAIANAGRIQSSRKRYWIIKYLESKRGNTYEALVLDCHRDHYNVLIKEFMYEAKLPVSGVKLKHGDIIQVTIQHADARRDQLSLFL